MGYSTSLPGLAEARLDAYKTLIVNSLTDLNMAMAVGSDLTGFPTLTSANVTLGDPRLIASGTATIAIYGGGEDNAVDIEQEEFFLSPSETAGLGARIYTTIDVWLHPDWTANITSAAACAAKNERAMARLLDHLRKRVFNVPANYTLTLTSREYATSPDYDVLTESKVQRVIKGTTEKEYGDGVRCQYGRLVLSAYIA